MCAAFFGGQKKKDNKTKKKKKKGNDYSKKFHFGGIEKDGFYFRSFFFGGKGETKRGRREKSERPFVLYFSLCAEKKKRASVSQGNTYKG